MALRAEENESAARRVRHSLIVNTNEKITNKKISKR